MLSKNNIYAVYPTMSLYFESAYIVNNNCITITKIDDFSCINGCVLKDVGPQISDNAALRCFTNSGFVSTYFIRIDESRIWPDIYRMEKIS